MAGAYVAKPDVPVVPEVPDDWNPDWPFPGAAPPGYGYEYSLQISGVSGISLSGNVVPTATIFDHDTYQTIPIAETVKQTWSGSIDGVAVNVRLQGAAQYGESAESAYSEFENGFWGASPELQFDLSSAETGDTLKIRVQSLIGGNVIFSEEEVEIAIGTLALVGPSTMSYDGAAHVSTALHFEEEPIEPVGETLTFTATLDGVLLRLREPGGEYADSLTLAFQSLDGGFSGWDGSIEFELTEEDDGKTVTLSVASEQSVGDNIEIAVASGYLLDCTLPESLLFYYRASCVIRVVDADGANINPGSDNKITVSATIGETLIQVRRSSSDSFANSIELTPVSIGSGRYGYSGPLYFDTGESDIDGTLTVTFAYMSKETSLEVLVVDCPIISMTLLPGDITFHGFDDHEITNIARGCDFNPNAGALTRAIRETTSDGVFYYPSDSGEFSGYTWTGRMGHISTDSVVRVTSLVYFRGVMPGDAFISHNIGVSVSVTYRGELIRQETVVISRNKSGYGTGYLPDKTNGLSEDLMAVNGLTGEITLL
jgi:hypothetical protein